MLDVRRMKVLKEVAARGSFSAAAEALAYTQSAVSQQIAALEREAGTRLVERNARGVRLTDAGVALVKHADAILARLDAAEQELAAMAGLRGGRVRLIAFPTAAASIGPLAIAEFKDRHPGVDVTMDVMDPPESLSALRSGEADVAITVEAGFDSCAADGDIDRTLLLEDPMYIALPRDHHLAERTRLRLGDLRDDAWMFGSGGSCPDTSIFMRACQTAGFEPRIAVQSDDYLAIQGMVAAGLGVSVIPDLALVAVRDDVVIRELAHKPPVRHIVAATMTGSWCSPAREAMLEILVEVSKGWAKKRTKLALVS